MSCKVLNFIFPLITFLNLVCSDIQPLKNTLQSNNITDNMLGSYQVETSDAYLKNIDLVPSSLIVRKGNRIGKTKEEYFLQYHKNKNLPKRKPLLELLPNPFAIKHPALLNTISRNNPQNNEKKPWFPNLPNVFPFLGGNRKEQTTSKPEQSLFDKLFSPVPSVSKFPPVVEFFVQKIQAAHSNYIYEDLSRPPTYDKPVYTLSPEDQIFFNLGTNGTTESMVGVENVNKKPSQSSDFEYEDIVTSTDKLFEIISKSTMATKLPSSSTTSNITGYSSGNFSGNSYEITPLSSTTNGTQSTNILIGTTEGVTDNNETSNEGNFNSIGSLSTTTQPNRTTIIPQLIEKNSENSDAHYGLPNVVHIKRSTVEQNTYFN